MKKSLALLAVVVALFAVMVQQAPEARSQTATPIKEMLGVDAVVNDNPSEIAQVAGWVRDYHKWYWYEATQGTYSWSTGWQQLDSFYGSLKAAGVKVMPDVELAPAWASSNGKTDGVPDATAHARYLGALVSHYGDTIAAVENYNEPDQTWLSVPFPADQFGAMTAQDYAAVKAANPNLPLVLAGMAGPDTNYLTTANQAAGGKFDVVNFHWYAQGDTTLGGKSPEAGGLFAAIDAVKSWRDANAPGKPVWMTEFGWDTFAQPDGQKSKIYAPEANAANYLLRAIFLTQGRGVDKGFAYIYRDPSGNATYLHDLYLSSGLVTDNNETDGRKKPGWYYLATLKNVLGDYVLDRIVSNGPNVYHYEYALPGTDKRAAVLWARNGDRDNGYQTAYQAPAGTLVQPTDGSTSGTTSTTDGKLTLAERPVFVLYSGAAAATATATNTVAPTQTSAPTSTPTATPVPTKSSVTASGTELLANGGFESGLANWFVPSWFAGTASTAGSPVHGGSNDLRFQGNVAGPYTYQEVAASPGQQLAFTGWVNVPQLNGDMSMAVELVPRHQNNGDLAAIPIATITRATNGWVQLSASPVMPDRTVAVRVRVRFPRLNGTAYLDDFSLKAVGSSPPPTATPAPTQPPSTPSATATAVPTVPPPTVTPSPTQPPATATLVTTQPPAGSGVLASTAWPTYGQNALRNNRSPFSGPQQLPNLKWTFNRTGDHWGTDYRGTDVGENGTVYLAAGMAGVYSIDSGTGQMKWLWSAESTGHETWVEFPPTVASDGKLYVASENDYLYALSPDGKVLWKFLANHLHTPVSISPDGSTLHFVSEDGLLYALNRGDGSVKWKFQLGAGVVYGTARRIPVTYDAAGNLYFTWVHTVWSLTPDGQKRWSLDVENRGAYMVGPAVGDDGTLYFVNTDALLAVGMDGRLKWQYVLDKSAFDRTPAIGADGTVYIGNDNGFVYAFRSDGALRWKQQYVTATGWGSGVKSNILVDSSGTLYFLGKDEFVYAVGSATQQVLWKYPTNLQDVSYPGLQLSLDADGTIYAPVDEGALLALSISGSSAGPVSSVPQGATATPAPTATSAPTVAPTVTPLPTTQPAPSPVPSGSALFGSWVGSAVNVAGNETAFEQAVGKPRAVRHWYWSVAPISHSAAGFTDWSTTMPAGAILMLSWAPSDTDSTLDNVNGGIHDGYIRDWARALKGYGREVWLRPMWEDNGNWYWWYSGADWDKTKKDKFKTAFQRIVQLFRQEGAGNVKFVWSPNLSGHGAATASLSYPGADYVDVVGLDGYPLTGGRGDFYSSFKPDYDALSALGKPMIVAETNASAWLDSDRAGYVANLLNYELPVRFPKFSALVWFSERAGDLLDPKYPLTLDAFKKAIAGSYYLGR